VTLDEARHGDDRLNPAARTAAVARLRSTSPQDPLDVLVVGGGVVGTGAALDAVSRGLKVALVEADDLASGTSSRSSRLAHGGLRYLEQREFGLVHEALTERGLLLDRIAPHLVHPVPFLFPLTKRYEVPYVGAGVHLYDMLSRVGSYGGKMPRPRTLSPAAVNAIAPGLDVTQLSGAARFYDAQIDDARHTLAVARSAAERGASVVTQARVTGLLRDGDDIVGAQVSVDGTSIDAYARVVVGAAGPWTDELLEHAGVTRDDSVRRSKGVHLIVHRSAFKSASAVIARTPVSVLFILPWGLNWIIGTTDDDYAGDLTEPSVTEIDVAYLIDQANRWLSVPLTHDDVIGVYAGIRPLVASDAEDSTTTLSREHVVMQPVRGLVAIAGGKYTTYRVMAMDVIDAAAELLRAVDIDVPESSTHEIPLVGAEGYRVAWSQRTRTAREWGIPVGVIEHLLRRHGDRLDDVLELLQHDRSLGGLIHPEAPYLWAEVVLAVTHEGATQLDDILVRRTRLALEVRDGGASATQEVARLAGEILGWDATKQNEQIQSFLNSSRARVPQEVTS
jgi:glycerol-3-phosphate dehydrogenase